MGDVFVWGVTRAGPAQRNSVLWVPTRVTSLALQSVVDVAAGESFFLFLTKSGAVFSLGAGDAGQLGCGSFLQYMASPCLIGAPLLGLSVKSIACGASHSICLTEDGGLWSFGLNKHGQLGLGHFENVAQPTRVPWRVVSTSVSCGASHTAVVSTDGSLWAWGSGEYGQLGSSLRVMSANPRYIPLLGAQRQTLLISRLACTATATVVVAHSGQLIIFGQLLGRECNGIESGTEELVYRLRESLRSAFPLQGAISSASPWFGETISGCAISSSAAIFTFATEMASLSSGGLVQLMHTKDQTNLKLHDEKTGESIFCHNYVLAARFPQLWEAVHMFIQPEVSEDQAQPLDTLCLSTLATDPCLADLAVWRAILEYCYSDQLGQYPNSVMQHVATAAMSFPCARLHSLALGGSRQSNDSTIFSDLRRMLSNRLGTDVVFVVGATSFHAHRALLSRSSEFFARLLSGEFVEATQHDVALSDLDPRVFAFILDFLYTGSVELLEQDDSLQSLILYIFEAANRLGLQQLATMCEDVAITLVDQNTAATFLEFSSVMALNRLKRHCVSFFIAFPALSLQKEVEPLLSPETTAMVEAARETHANISCGWAGVVRKELATAATGTAAARPSAVSTARVFSNDGALLSNARDGARHSHVPTPEGVSLRPNATLIRHHLVLPRQVSSLQPQFSSGSRIAGSPLQLDAERLEHLSPLSTTPQLHQEDPDFLDEPQSRPPPFTLLQLLSDLPLVKKIVFMNRFRVLMLCGNGCLYDAIDAQSTLRAERLQISETDLVIDVAASTSGSFFVYSTASGEVFASGVLPWSPRQAAAKATVPIFRLLEGSVPVVRVTAGEDFVVALTAHGRLLAWGRGDVGQTGCGDTYTTHHPREILLPPELVLDRVAEVECGSFHSLCRTKGGVLMSWGCGSVGQLGLGSLAHAYTPQIVSEFRYGGCTAIACGRWHSVAVDAGGRVWVWGSGTDGQLGRGQRSERLALVPQRVVALQNVRICRVVAGGHSTLCVSDHEQIFSWGGIAQVGTMKTHESLAVHADLATHRSTRVCIGAIAVLDTCAVVLHRDRRHPAAASVASLWGVTLFCDIVFVIPVGVSSSGRAYVRVPAHRIVVESAPGLRRLIWAAQAELSMRGESQQQMLEVPVEDCDAALFVLVLEHLYRDTTGCFVSPYDLRVEGRTSASNDRCLPVRSVRLAAAALRRRFEIELGTVKSHLCRLIDGKSDLELSLVPPDTLILCGNEPELPLAHSTLLLLKGVPPELLKPGTSATRFSLDLSRALEHCRVASSRQTAHVITAALRFLYTGELSAPPEPASFGAADLYAQQLQWWVDLRRIGEVLRLASLCDVAVEQLGLAMCATPEAAALAMSKILRPLGTNLKFNMLARLEQSLFAESEKELWWRSSVLRALRVAERVGGGGLEPEDQALLQHLKSIRTLTREIVEHKDLPVCLAGEVLNEQQLRSRLAPHQPCRAIIISYCPLADGPFFAEIARLCPELESISLDGCVRVTLEDLKILLESCPRLNRISARQTNIDPKRAALLAPFRTGQVSLELHQIITRPPPENGGSSLTESSGTDLQ
eukprot:TRINITY_DN5538_c0_g1_i1.p1 TRINITY_DN5538_c0_g1~~TRINITY_DN5538_c0_g1_i1.p1  ORF type:complete len:1656 (+),score=251.52 TRINITY_DN5538_c0_g1_i1:241-4968(+)